MKGNKGSRGKLAEILREMPKMHFWNGEWQSGGLSGQLLDDLYDVVFDSIIAHCNACSKRELGCLH